MDRLILVRHAEALPRGPGQRDIERALSPAGDGEAEALGRALGACGLQPDRAIVSSATRARQTWEGAQPALGQAHLRIEPQLYNAAAGDIGRLLQEASGRTVMVVAHNPGIALFAAHLAEQAGAPAAAAAIRNSFAPATAAVFSYRDGAPGFERLFRPAEYMSQA